MKVVREFPCEPGSVSASRLLARRLLADSPDELRDAVELMTTELATNCIRHAHTGFELVIDVHDGVRVEVRDTGSGQPVMLSPTPRSLTGRGLRIVDSLADSWGVTRASEGKAVWFEKSSDGVNGIAA
jgi:anti-sigma regulatory factor (Ser/Thr protein kinase)